MIELLVPEGREIVVHGQVRRVMQAPKPAPSAYERFVQAQAELAAAKAMANFWRAYDPNTP